MGNKQYNKIHMDICMAASRRTTWTMPYRLFNSVFLPNRPDIKQYFFSHNKSTNIIFSHSFLAKRTAASLSNDNTQTLAIDFELCSPRRSAAYARTNIRKYIEYLIRHISKYSLCRNSAVRHPLITLLRMNSNTSIHRTIWMDTYPCMYNNRIFL
jgi:hypothetical protein